MACNPHPTMLPCLALFPPPPPSQEAETSSSRELGDGTLCGGREGGREGQLGSLGGWGFRVFAKGLWRVSCRGSIGPQSSSPPPPSPRRENGLPLAGSGEDEGWQEEGCTGLALKGRVEGLGFRA